jgi:hypothetical protein
MAALMLSYGLTSGSRSAGRCTRASSCASRWNRATWSGRACSSRRRCGRATACSTASRAPCARPAVADLEIAKAKAMDVDFMKSYVRAPIPIMSRIAQGALDLGVPSGTHMIEPGAATGIGRHHPPVGHPAHGLQLVEVGGARSPTRTPTTPMARAIST